MKEQKSKQNKFSAAGDCLRHERESRKISLRKLADSVNLTPSAVHGIETGIYRPSCQTAINIAEALELGARVRLRLRRVWEAPDRQAFEQWVNL